MPRLQISDEFANERLQTQARPMTPTVQAHQPQPDQTWEKLAGVFDAAGVMAEKEAARQNDEERTRAQQYANSMTVAELGKAIKEGKMLPSQSPVFAATVQHVWGANSQAAAEREVLGKINTGELTFNSPQEIDTYLTEHRNTTLSGQSKYAAAGFDKAGSAFREKLMDAVAKTNDAKMVAAAEGAASDSLSNTLLQVTDKGFQGTPDDAASTILSQYQLLRKTKVMSDATAKSALQNVIVRAASSGQVTVLDALLKQELPDVGTVRSFLGETKAATLVNQATAEFDKGQRQRIDDEVLPHYQAADDGNLNVEKFLGWAQSPENKKYISSATIHSITRANQAALAAQQRMLQHSQIEGAMQASEYEAQRRVDAALSKGTLWEVQGTNNPKVLTKTGDTKDFNVKEFAEQALKAKTANLPFEQQVSSWAQNGIANPDWDNQLKAGLFNLSSIGVDSKGKPTGQLNEAGKTSIELFKKLDATNPDYAKQVAGEGAYKRFSDIAFLMHLGRDASDAASIASNAASGALAGTPIDKLDKSIRAKVAEMTDTPWSDWLSNSVHTTYDAVRRNNPLALAGALTYGVMKDFGGVEKPPEWLKVDLSDNTMHNTTPNTAQVHVMVKRYATLLAHSGQVGDADTALKVAVDYISNPRVSAKVNGTLYLRSEMPSAPSASRTAEEWFERFIDEVPKVRAKQLGFAGSEVRLEYDERSRVYRAFVAGVPLTTPEGGLFVWPKGAIQQWYAAKDQEDIVNVLAQRKARRSVSVPEGKIKGLTPREYNAASQHLAPK